MVIIIAAKAHNNVIGKDNALPWHIPEDLKRFKEKTSGKPVIMGWNTFVSILERLGRPLPDRQHFVLTSKSMLEITAQLQRLADRNPNFRIGKVWKTVIFCKSFGTAVHRAELFHREVYAIGGERVYQEALKSAERMELTELSDSYEGDAYFPEFNPNNWTRQEHGNQTNDPTYQFVTYSRQRV